MKRTVLTFAANGLPISFQFDTLTSYLHFVNKAKSRAVARGMKTLHGVVPRTSGGEILLAYTQDNAPTCKTFAAARRALNVRPMWVK